MEIDSGSTPHHTRRLPIYLLLGTPESMAGAPIQAINQGVNLLYNELMNDASAIETVWISVITFNDQAQIVVPLTEITQFTPPTLSAGGKEHALGAALRLLREALDRDIIPNTPERKGDYKPLVFLMTDSMPTDDWEDEADAIKNRTRQKVATIIALGCGGGVDQSTLKRITEVVLLMDTVTPDQITQFFKWVSQSVPARSEQGTETPPSLMPLPPGGIRITLRAEEPTSEQVEPQEEEPATSVPDQIAVPAKALEAPDVLACVLADGTMIECEAQPFLKDEGQGGEGVLYWSKDGNSVISLYGEMEPQQEVRLQRLISEYDVVEGDPYWEKLFSWPRAIVKQPSPGCVFCCRPREGWHLSWLLSRKGRQTIAQRHSEEELGTWVNNLSIVIKVARIVHRLHLKGIAHPDLSPAVLLVAPKRNQATLIRCDELMIPGTSPPPLVGWLSYMAPELVAQTYSSEKQVSPSVQTNQHSLATIIYQLLFLRHPLVGPKEHSPDPALDEVLSLGERALFIEHPADTSNRPDNLQMPYTSMLTPAVQRLVERAFVEGLHDPERRPTAAEWERDLVRMADSIVPCVNPKCPLQAFVLPQVTPVRCPACDTLLDNPPVLPILHFYRPVTGSRGQFENDDGYILVGWPGRTLHAWHTDAGQAPGPGVDTVSMARLEFDAAEKRWHLVNEAIDGLRILKEDGNHQQVPVGSSCELVDGMRLLLGQADEARLAFVQIQRLWSGG